MTVGIDAAEPAASALPDLASLFKNIPFGAWVALSRDQSRVVAFAADMRSALEEAHRLGENSPIMLKVPNQASALIL